MVRGAGVWLALLLCLGAVVAASTAGPVTFTGEGLLDDLRPASGSLEAAPPVEQGDELPTETREVGEPVLGVPIEVLLAVVVVIVGSALLVRSLLRARHEPDPVDDEDEPVPDETVPVDVLAVTAAARRGLQRLDGLSGRDPTEVVVACWVELELAGGASGSAHVATDTPTDFARRLAAAVPALDRADLDRLRQVYSRVRYGRDGADADDVAVARACLAGLLDAVGAGSGAERPR